MITWNAGEMTIAPCLTLHGYLHVLPSRGITNASHPLLGLRVKSAARNLLRMRPAEAAKRVEWDLVVDLPEPAVAQPARHLAAADVQLAGQFPGREAVEGGVGHKACAGTIADLLDSETTLA